MNGKAISGAEFIARCFVLWLTFLLAPCSLLAQGSAIRTVSFDSPILHKSVFFDVILPAGYEASERRYPVLYLLHGFGDHYSAWTTKSNVSAYSRKYPLILVMPEGENGWYTNGLPPSNQWENHFMAEVIPYVREHFRTLQGQRMSAIAGYSMGGYGALKLGLKYRDQFSFAASLSGSLKITDWSDNVTRNIPATSSAIAVFGAEHSPLRSENALTNLLNSKGGELPFIYLDCGTEDDLFPASREFSSLLQQKQVRHEYRERPGRHDWREWDHQIKAVLQVLAEYWDLLGNEAANGD